MKKKLFLAGFAVLSIAAIFMLAGCKDPVTGEEHLTGKLRIVNEHAGDISRVYVRPNGGGDAVWDATPKYLDTGTGKVINYGEEMTFSNVPTGTWQIQVAGATINNVKISAGLTTTVTNKQGRILIAGNPL